MGSINPKSQRSQIPDPRSPIDRIGSISVFVLLYRLVPNLSYRLLLRHMDFGAKKPKWLGCRPLKKKMVAKRKD